MSAETIAESAERGQQSGVWRLRRTASDLYLRSRSGGFLHVLGWVVLGLTADLHRNHPLLAGAILIAIVSLAVWRSQLSPPLQGDAAALRAWLRRYGILLVAASALWGAVQPWILLDPAFNDSSRTASLVATIGFATVFANVYAMHRAMAAWGSALVFLPSLAVLWLKPGELGLAVIFTVYGGYLVLAVLGSHADYRRRLNLDQALREQRDLFEQLSRTDGLTGLANRRRFAEALETRAADAAAMGGDLALLIVDIDHFKRVNDTHGHSAGDACLKAVADRLQRCFPEPDAVLARLGGEEFGVLIRTDFATAARRAEALRQSLHGQPVDCDGEAVTITASIGVGWLAQGADGDRLYRAADAALYRAKAEGRNRVSAAREAAATA
jgi:diguanylate cyclase